MEKLQQTYQMIGIFLSMIELSVNQYMDISVSLGYYANKQTLVGNWDLYKNCPVYIVEDCFQLLFKFLLVEFCPNMRIKFEWLVKQSCINDLLNSFSKVLLEVVCP